MYKLTLKINEIKYNLFIQILIGFQAIGLVGDRNIQGKRKSITAIMLQNKKRIFIPIDITKIILFNSLNFYFAQNDGFYIVPYKTRVISLSVISANTLTKFYD